MPFIGQRGGYRRVSWGGGARWSRVKRRKGECCWGWSRAAGNLERLLARQDKVSTGIQRGADWRAVMALPRFSGQVSVRGGKGRKGEGKWEWCSDPRASGQPRGRQVKLSTCKPIQLELLPTRCLWKWPQEFRICDFENFQFGCSLFWISIPEIFLVGPEVVFC
jgi:hypothetical protein